MTQSMLARLGLHGDGWVGGRKEGRKREHAARRGRHGARDGRRRRGAVKHAMDVCDVTPLVTRERG